MTSTPIRPSAPAGALTLWVVEHAGRAPSVHNTQPWLWRARGAEIELWADRSRQLPVADPHGRELALSCGAALHHAQVAACALGHVADLMLVPDSGVPDLLATLHLCPRERNARSAADFRALETRCTDRRRFTNWRVPDERLKRLAGSVDLPRVYVVALTEPTMKLHVELLALLAIDRQEGDPDYAAELSEWIDHGPDDGMPGGAEPPGVTLASSDGLLAICTDSDDVESWLHAGMALSKLWLEATVQGLSVVPISQVVELDDARRALRDHVFAGLMHPQILVRIGWQEIGRRELPRTPRRPVDDILLGERGTESGQATSGT